MVKRLTQEQRLTPEMLEAIRKRAEAAQEGPWLSLPEINGEDFAILTGDRDDTVAFGVYEAANAEFIAHAREDIPALLAEVEAQESQIQRLAQDWSAVVDERNSLLAEVERLRAVIADFADYGTRHDTNPTIGGRIKRFDDVAGWVTYLRSMDDSVRRRAKEALGE